MTDASQLRGVLVAEMDEIAKSLAGGTEPLNLPEARLTEDEPRGE